MDLRHSPARTKLSVPELRASHVPRPTLVQRLDELVAEYPVTLVTGFAGSGKSVLLAEFARSRAGNVAWLSCDVTDADPSQFWTAFVAVLRRFDPALGANAVDLLEADGELGYEAIASLVNDLFDLDGEHVLVIDDLHFVARSALESLGHLLDRLPETLRVVLSTRSDPRLPLHRWRAGGLLGELRAAELRLNAEEVGNIVRKVGVDVSPDDAAILASRTEGWAAGVQLAALSMRHEVQPADFVHAFAGTDRNVADYLVGEVLRRQPDDTVAFLLDTSVLDELSAPLCDVLTERSDSAEMLDRLEREHLFVIPLDNAQARYRYHHLFAELLRRMLTARSPGRALTLHRAASDWYIDHADPRRALRHALLAEDPALLTRLLQGLTFSEYFTGSSEMVRGWIGDLSRARRDMPTELLVEYALTLLLVGAIEDARACLTRVDSTQTVAAMSRARLELAHALAFGLRGEAARAIDAAEQARAIAAPSLDPSVDGLLEHIQVRCYIYTDDLAAARRTYELALAQPDVPEQLGQVLLAGIWSQGELEAGELDAAHARALASTADAARLGGEAHFGASEALRTLGTLAYEHDHLDEAEQFLERCVEIIGAARPPFLLLTLIESARVWNARGDLDAAFVDLDRARAALPAGAQSPLNDRVDGYRARLLAENGAVAGARELAALLPPGHRRSIIETRCNLADRNGADARVSLEALASSPMTPRQTLEYALLDARVALVEQDPALHAKLQRVLELARPAVFIRTLADEGAELAKALADEVHRQLADDYSNKLAPVLERVVAAEPAHNVPLFAGVMLSERELTVLKYLATRLTTREIAGELFVSMNTFRSHSKSIYRKLGVDSRAAAVEAARAHGVF